MTQVYGATENTSQNASSTMNDSRSSSTMSSSSPSNRNYNNNNTDINDNTNITDDPTEDLVPAPRDRYNFIYIGFIILGVTTLLPWNFFITATDYWMYKFRNVSEPTGDDQQTLIYYYNRTYTLEKNAERTLLQTFFESYLAIASNLAMLSTMILNTLYGQRFDQKKRLYVSLTLMLIIFVITTIFVLIDTDQIQYVFFGITIVLVILISSSSAIFQSAIFGSVSSFPSHCMHAMVGGQAVAGLLAVVVQILSMSRDIGPIMSGLWYFLASTLFLALAIVIYWFMDTEYTRHYLNPHGSTNSTGTTQDIETASNNVMSNKAELIEALRDSWHFALSVAVVFWSTLSVFPAVSVLILPQHPDTSFFTGRFFTPITTFFLFNLGDLVGRICSSYVPLPIRAKKLLLSLTFGRIFISFLILFCNVTPRRHTPVLFQSDLYYPIFNTLMAVTNGYVFSSAMVMASKNCQRNRSELTGFIMATSLGVGLTLGSFTSTILLNII